MPTWLLVGIGGFGGAVARFLVSPWVQSLLGGATVRQGGFPFGTMTVNVIGCLAAGSVLAWIRAGSAEGAWSENANALLVVGFCGALTTFSALGIDTFDLLAQKRYDWVALSTVGNLILGCGMAALGFVVVSNLLASDGAGTSG